VSIRQIASFGLAALFVMSCDPAEFERCDGTKLPKWAAASGKVLSCKEGHLTILAVEAPASHVSGARRFSFHIRAGTEFPLPEEKVALSVEGGVILATTGSSAKREVYTNADGVASVDVESNGDERLTFHSSMDAGKREAEISIEVERFPLRALFVDAPKTPPQRNIELKINVLGYVDEELRFPATSSQFVHLCFDPPERFSGKLTHRLDNEGVAVFAVVPRAAGLVDVRICGGGSCDATTVCEPISFDVLESALRYVVLEGKGGPLPVGGQLTFSLYGFADSRLERQAAGTVRVCASESLIPSRRSVALTVGQPSSFTITATSMLEEGWVAACPADTECARDGNGCDSVSVSVKDPFQAVAMSLEGRLLEGSSATLHARVYSNAERTTPAPDGIPVRYCSSQVDVWFSPTTGFVKDGAVQTTVTADTGSVGSKVRLSACRYELTCEDSHDCPYLDAHVGAPEAQTL
jgi:hypothetical protein